MKWAMRCRRAQVTSDGSITSSIYLEEANTMKHEFTDQYLLASITTK